MSERKFAVKLTEGQSVEFTRCDPTLEVFDNARRLIGCDMIEIIHMRENIGKGFVMLVDEEAKLKGNRNINCIASHLYGSQKHGDPLVGHVVIVADAGDELQLLTSEEASRLTFILKYMRDASVE